MFTLSDQTCTLAHFNVRTELHGEDRKPAADLKCVLKGPNSLLELFDPELREAIYKSPPARGADELFEAEPPLNVLRFPSLGAIRWDKPEVGRDVVIEWGIDDESAMRFALATVDHFRIVAKQGGTIELTFRVRCYPTAEDAGKLFELQQQELTITVKEPAQGSLALVPPPAGNESKREAA